MHLLHGGAILFTTLYIATGNSIPGELLDAYLSGSWNGNLDSKYFYYLFHRY